MPRLALATVLAVLAGAAPALAADVSVDATENQFVPDEVTIAVGDTVTVSNDGPGSHNLRWQDQPTAVASGTTWSSPRTFTSPGSYPFLCEFHGGMNGTVTVGTSYTWKGANDAPWNDPVNWTPAGVPGAADTATITAGAPSLFTPVSVGTLNISGAGRTGGGTLTVINGGTWTSASLSFGTTVVAPGAQVTWTGGNLASAEIENQGTLSLKDIQMSELVGPAPLIDNKATLNVAGTISRMLAAGRLDNTGTIISGEGATLSVPLANAGTLTVGAPQLHITMGTVAPNGGDVVIPAGRTLKLSGVAYNAPAGADIAGAGSLELAGDLVLDGTATVGTLRANGGKRTGTGTVTAGNLQLLANSLYDGAGSTIVTANQTVAGGTIQIDRGHRMRFAGDVTVQADAYLLIGNGTGDESGTFEVAGKLTAPTARLEGPADGTGVMRILPTGSFEVPAGELLMNQVLRSEGTTKVIGTLNAPNGAEVTGGTTTLDGTFTGGALHLKGGTLTGSGISEEAFYVTGGTLAPIGSLDLAELHMSAGTLAVRLDAADSYSQVIVPGAQSTHLGGTLAVTASFTPKPTDEFRIVQTQALPDGTFASIVGTTAKVRTDATGAVLHSFPAPTTGGGGEEQPPPPPPAPAATVTPVPTPVPEPPVSTVALPRFGTLVKLPKCATRRSVKVRLLAPAASAKVKLGRKLLKTVRLGRPVTLKRLPRRAFTLAVEVTLNDGRLVKGGKRFRACR